MTADFPALEAYRLAAKYGVGGFRRLKLCADAALTELQQYAESLKCCGNCANYQNYTGRSVYHCILSARLTTPSSKCWYLPGVDHWTARRRDDEAH